MKTYGLDMIFPKYLMSNQLVHTVPAPNKWKLEGKTFASLPSMSCQPNRHKDTI